MASWETKPGADLTDLAPEIGRAIEVAAEIYARRGVTLVVTSGRDGLHKHGSLHYVGRAVDLRTYTLDPADRRRVRDELQLALGRDYDVVLEGDHIHLEYDPKS